MNVLGSSSENPRGTEIPTYPEHIGIFQVRLRISLLSVNESWELGGITEEKDWGVIEHPIEISLFGLELDRKSLHKTQIPGLSLTRERL